MLSFDLCPRDMSPREVTNYLCLYRDIQLGAGDDVTATKTIPAPANEDYFLNYLLTTTSPQNSSYYVRDV